MAKEVDGVRDRHLTGQTTVNKKAPIQYIISINDKVYRPSKNVSKNPPQNWWLWSLNRKKKKNLYELSDVCMVVETASSFAGKDDAGGVTEQAET